MKTEETVKKTIRNERRKLFWRLYSLPWIISVIVLIILSMGFIWVIRDISKSNIEKESLIHMKGIEEGKQLLYKEAIDAEVGMWEVNREGIVTFQWAIIHPRNPRNPRNNSVTNNINDYQFGVTDYRLSKRLGMDLEESIIDIVQLSIHQTFTEYVNEGLLDLSILENRLNSYTAESIRKSFDGFETYNKLKGESWVKR